MVPVPVHGLLADPAWLPDRIDWKNRLVRLVRARRSILRDSAFLDGRTPLSADPDQIVTVSLEDLAALSGTRRRLRWILHESFCGSTLAGRLLSVPDISLCLREPQVLVDLCNWRATISQPGELADFAHVCDGVLAKLAQRWSDEEAIVIKPSNWVNPIIHELVRADRGDRALCIRMDAEAFLIAVFRGGRERVDYTLRFYQQFVAHWPELGRVVDREIGRSAEPLHAVAQLVAAALWIQECTFKAYFSQDLDRHSLFFPAFVHRLEDNMDRAARVLNLHIPGQALRQSVDHHALVHAKDLSRGRRQDEEEAQNRTIAETYRQPIRIAAAFLDRLRNAEAETVGGMRAVMAKRVGGPAAAAKG